MTEKKEKTATQRIFLRCLLRCLFKKDVTEDMKKVAIIGAGKGGTAIFQLLKGNTLIKIVGVADINDDAEGIKLARQHNVLTTNDCLDLLKTADIDVIIDLTNNKSVNDLIYKHKNPSSEVIGGLSAKIVWNLVEERDRSKEETKRLLSEYEALYNLGIAITSSDSLEDIYFKIVDFATKIINVSAGSIAIFDEKSGEMHLVAVKGFSSSFSKKHRWKLRREGLTSVILNQNEPLVISDTGTHPEFNNPLFVREGIKSLVAVPLKAEGKIVGILYVDDFTKRDFSALVLLATYAAMAIERAKLLEDTKLMAITDDLTMLYNHRHFIYCLSAETLRAKRYKRSLSLLMLDIDYFKKYNDAYGHQQGNEILRGVSRILRNECRGVDVVARYGGEEFAVIMPETTRHEALKFADRLRKSIEDYEFPHEDTQPGGNLTISLGLACFPIDATTVAELTEKADMAMYQAKEKGKNHVCSFSPELAEHRKS